MSTLRFFNTHYVKAKRTNLAIEARCELCGTEQALDNLEIHTFIDEDEAGEIPFTELKWFLLVLCSRCHYDLHRFLAATSEQEVLIQRRRNEIRQKIREILAYNQTIYTPVHRYRRSRPDPCPLGQACSCPGNDPGVSPAPKERRGP